MTNLEYRFNFFIDCFVQPTLTALIEILLWTAIFKGAQTASIAGFSENSYISYALWAAFFARIAASWTYEFRMIAEIESGSINSLIVRPFSFYEYYLSQLMGYKFVTTLFSLIVPLAAARYFNLVTDFSKVPLAILLCFYYLILVHSISMLITTFAFHLNKISSLSIAKNLALWLLTGELFPLDLLPATAQKIIVALPFSAGTYLPVGYISGRVNLSQMMQGFASVTISLVLINLLGAWLWKRGLDSYSGTGA